VRFEKVFKPLDFLAEVTQHIPKKGAHQQAASKKTLTEKKKVCIKWAQLIKAGGGCPENPEAQQSLERPTGKDTQGH